MLEWDLTHERLTAYAFRHGIVVPPPSAPGRRPPIEIPAHLEVAFDHGVPVAVNGVHASSTSAQPSNSVRYDPLISPQRWAASIASQR